MSDNEGTTKKSGYRLEYATSARSKCKGPKPCAGSPITKGELRVGSVVDFRGNTSYAWRHWGCTTAKIISNMKSQFESADELDGFDDLKDEDKERLRKAWEEGKVADEDIPETARKAPGEEAEDEKRSPRRGHQQKPRKMQAERMVRSQRENVHLQRPRRRRTKEMKMLKTSQRRLLRGSLGQRKLQLRQMLRIRESLRRNQRSVRLRESLLPRRK
ncbi:hypothetical protein BDR07DRAFT_702010 [Suillus spraguei]|nr:hypothetical protein BDR07DRAFT_702010 [Suillus spraguei]